MIFCINNVTNRKKQNNLVQKFKKIVEIIQVCMNPDTNQKKP